MGWMHNTLLATTISLVACAVCAQETADQVAPEKATSLGSEATSHNVRVAQEAKDSGRPIIAQEWMVAAANPLAVSAGARVLSDGGSAADAMVAVQAVLGLVEPQSSGLGGGAFLVWYNAETGEITTLDGRETAPLAAGPKLFLDDEGQPLQFFDAVVGGRSVGVPGTPALLQTAHAKWGRKEWASLFIEAIRLADEGFPVSARLAEMVSGDAERLSVDPDARDYFLPEGIPLKAGQVLKNTEYAETLRALAGQGVGQFYSGKIAKEIVAKVRGIEGNPGLLSEIDMGIYQVRERPAVCVRYRAHDVCGMGPPSSGALSVGQILGMLDSFDLAALGATSVEAWRLIGDASRLAFADRGRYVADSDYVPVPVKGLLASDYLKQRGELLESDQALTEVVPGSPEFDHALIYADDDAIEFPSTSHISIVDSLGNALSMTTTIENAFGSRLMVRGFLLNNELTDFSFRSHRDGVPVANRVAPGKRPRSSMAPTLVMKDGKPVLVVGSPGGSRIIGYVAKTIIAYLDWGMDVQEAVSLPHLINRFGTYEIEEATMATNLRVPLTTMGFDVKIRELNSGLHAIAIEGEQRQITGGADPRREGIALGD